MISKLLHYQQHRSIVFKFAIDKELQNFQQQVFVYLLNISKSKGDLFCLLVRVECVRQRNEVAIKLGIIFPPPPLSLSPVIC